MDKQINSRYRQGKQLFPKLDEVQDFAGEAIDNISGQLDMPEMGICEDKFRYLFDQSLMAILVIRDNAIVDYNQAFANLTGYRKNEINNWVRGEHFKLVYPDDYELVMKKKSVLEEMLCGETVHFVFRIVSKGGQIKWLENFSRKVMFNGIEARFITLIDRTLMKQTEEKLKETQEILGAFMHQLPHAAFIKDHQRNLIFKNEYMMGRETIKQRIEAENADLDELTELIEETSEIDRKVLEGGSYNEIIEIGVGNSTEYWQLTKFQISRHNNPPMIGGIAEDVSEMIKSKREVAFLNEELEQKVRDRTSLLNDALEEYRFENEERRRTEVELIKMNEELQTAKELVDKDAERLQVMNEKLVRSEASLKEANDAKDMFFSIIAHDLKNPMQSLLMNAELLYRNHEKFEGDQMLKVFSSIYTETNNISSLLRNLLQWSQTQTGRIQYIPEAFVLGDVIEECVELFRGSIEQKRIKFRISDEVEAKVYADKNMARTIIRNLLNNAIKFTDINGQIEIGTALVKGFAGIYVKDNGIGIKEDDLEKTFKMNERYGARNVQGNGSGLGLILCKEFVEINGGKITVKSKYGQGSVFTFTLPLHEGRES